MDQFLDFLEGSQEGRRKLVESDMSHNMDKSFLSAITSTISLQWDESQPLSSSPLFLQAGTCPRSWEPHQVEKANGTLAPTAQAGKKWGNGQCQRRMALVLEPDWLELNYSSNSLALCLNFTICKIKMTIVPKSEGHCKDLIHLMHLK